MRIIFVSLAVVLADQISKLIVKGFSIPFLHISYAGMSYGETISVIGNFFRITFIENPGLAFGFDPGINFKLWVSLFSLFASIVLLIFLYTIRNRNFTTRLAIALILGGAVGNLIDRMFYGVFYNYAPLFYGRVVDFLDFDFIRFSLFGRNFDRFPIFNIADSAVTIGVFLLILFYPKAKKETEPTALEAVISDPVVENTQPELNSGTNEAQNEILNKDKEIQNNVEPDFGKKVQD